MHTYQPRIEMIDSQVEFFVFTPVYACLWSVMTDGWTTTTEIKTTVLLTTATTTDIQTFLKKRSGIP